MQTWPSDQIPQDAIDDFIDEDDPETSLWNDGIDGDRREDVILALAFARFSIGKFALALLWQDDPAIVNDAGSRIIQSDGETPYAPAIPLHYHLSKPEAVDYERLVRAVMGRNEYLVKLSAESVRNLIQNAFLAGSVPSTGIRPKLQAQINELIDRRFVRVNELDTSAAIPIFDLRHPTDVIQKIQNAEFVDPAKLESTLHLKRVGKKDPFIIYCQDGRASLEVARGFWKNEKTVRVLIGGMNEWTRCSLPTEAC